VYTVSSFSSLPSLAARQQNHELSTHQKQVLSESSTVSSAPIFDPDLLSLQPLLVISFIVWIGGIQPLLELYSEVLSGTFDAGHVAQVICEAFLRTLLLTALLVTLSSEQPERKL
jgi:hypothetical protein